MSDAFNFSVRLPYCSIVSGSCTLSEQAECQNSAVSCSKGGVHVKATDSYQVLCSSVLTHCLQQESAIHFHLTMAG